MTQVESPQGPGESSVAAPSIGTVTAATDPFVDPRTGEPRRPLAVHAASALFFVAAGLALAGLLHTFWLSIDGFVDAAWLHGVTPTEPGDLLRVGMVSGEFAIALLVGSVTTITGYYAWWGYRWTRWSGLIAVALACGSLVINPLAAWSIAAVAIGSGLLWLPVSRAFAERWHTRRHPAPPTPVIVDEVFYGPLPRYR